MKKENLRTELRRSMQSQLKAQKSKETKKGRIIKQDSLLGIKGGNGARNEQTQWKKN